MKKILIVEDEKTLRDIYQDKFKQTGEFEVVLAETAEQGIEMARKIKPDLILLDILLPRANGIGFMGWLKKDKELASVPVIAFSNYDDPKTRKEAADFGIKEYLIKTNYTPQEIINKIKSYFKN